MRFLFLLTVLLIGATSAHALDDETLTAPTDDGPVLEDTSKPVDIEQVEKEAGVTESAPELKVAPSKVNLGDLKPTDLGSPQSGFSDLKPDSTLRDETPEADLSELEPDQSELPKPTPVESELELESEPEVSETSPSSKTNVIAEEGESKTTTTLRRSELEPESDHVRRGNWEIGTNFGLGHSSLEGAMIDIQPRIQYFVFERFSLGVVGEYHHSDLLETRGVGPTMALYILQGRRWASYLSQTVVWSESSELEAGEKIVSGLTALGLNYFVSSSSALGMSLNHSYVLDDSRAAEGASTFVRGHLSFYF